LGSRNQKRRIHVLGHAPLRDSEFQAGGENTIEEGLERKSRILEEVRADGP